MKARDSGRAKDIREITTEVLIVGAGPTGLMLACDLQRRGIPFHLIDRCESPSTLSRAVGLQARTLEAFGDLGIVEALLRKGTILRAVRCYNNGRLHHCFELEKNRSGEVPYPYHLILEQHVTESILIDKLASLGASVHRGVELKSLSDEPDQVQCLIRSDSGDQHVRSSYVVGCDGPHSAVRRLRRIGYTGSGSELLYHVADVELEWSLPGRELVWLVEGETEVVAIPLPCEGRYRLNLWKAEKKRFEGPDFGAQEGPLELETWREILTRLAPCDVTLSKIRSSLAYRTGQGIADAFQVGRTFLAGDAAHAVPQCTANGLNLGLQDAYNLGWKLDLVVNGDAPPELLETYQRERRPIALAALSSTGSEPSLMGRASQFESREALDRWSQMDLDYRHSLTKFTSLEGAIVQAGDRAPDGLLSREGSAVYLYDLVPGVHYHLLVFKDFEDDALEQLILELKNRYGPIVQIVCVGLAGDALLDRGSRLHRAYAAQHGELILIRPDRFIAARSTLADSAELKNYLSEHLAPSIPI